MVHKPSDRNKRKTGDLTAAVGNHTSVAILPHRCFSHFLIATAAAFQTPARKLQEAPPPMPPKRNPLGLNALQLKTLTLFQALARLEVGDSLAGTEPQPVAVTRIPEPHGNHFHLGSAVVSSADATGLHNPSVWLALQRKGLVVGTFPNELTVTAAGMTYDTGLADALLHHSDH